MTDKREYLVEYYYEDAIRYGYRNFRNSLKCPVYHGFNADAARTAYIKACKNTDGITEAVVMHVREGGEDADWEWLADNEINDGSLRLHGYISLDGGKTLTCAEDTVCEIEENNLWDIVFAQMDDEVRETVRKEYAPCSNEEFLQLYLYCAQNDFIIRRFEP